MTMQSRRLPSRPMAAPAPTTGRQSAVQPTTFPYTAILAEMRNRLRSNQGEIEMMITIGAVNIHVLSKPSAITPSCLGGTVREGISSAIDPGAPEAEALEPKHEMEPPAGIEPATC